MEVGAEDFVANSRHAPQIGAQACLPTLRKPLGTLVLKGEKNAISYKTNKAITRGWRHD